MVVGQKIMERTNSSTFCWRSTDKGSFGTDMYEYLFISSVSEAIYAILFLLKPSADRRGPQFYKHWYKKWIRNMSIKNRKKRSYRELGVNVTIILTWILKWDFKLSWLRVWRCVFWDTQLSILEDACRRENLKYHSSDISVTNENKTTWLHGSTCQKTLNFKTCGSWLSATKPLLLGTRSCGYLRSSTDSIRRR
jgi:hypothetical protein